MGGRLNGKVAIITGGSGGQGEATAQLFVAEGARVVIADVVEEKGRAIAESLGDVAVFQRLDVTDEQSWGAAVAATVERFGGVDVLINNAGITHFTTVMDIARADLDRVFGINVFGVALGMKTVAPAMLARGGGSIVNISSTQGLAPMNGVAIYVGSKFAVRGMSRAAALELGPQGIRVNAIFPGGINTPMGNVTGEPADTLDKYYVGQPIARIGEPIEVARTSLFLASDEASYICGAEIAVDGGMTAGIYSALLPGAPERLPKLG